MTRRGGIANATTKRLYAWANPIVVPGSPLDHTWVTSYDNNANSLPNVGAVVTAHEDYWFCWGSFHPQGTHAEPSKWRPWLSAWGNQPRAMSSVVERGLIDHFWCARHNIFLWRRRRLPPIGQPSALCNRNRRHAATYRRQCGGLQGELGGLWDLRTST
jgi:hypothetical protein